MGYKYETHMHSSEVSTCGIKTAKEQVRVYKQKGYTGIILTDHFVNGYTNCPRNSSWRDKMIFFASGYENAKKEGEKCGLDVFFGLEYTILGSDFLTYGLDLDFLIAHPDIDKLPIEKYSEIVRQNGGFIAQAHPFREDPWVANPFPVHHSLLDAVEVFNTNMRDTWNEEAMEFADLHKLPKQAGSDSHGHSGRFISGVELDKKADSIFDIINAIKNSEAKLILPM